VTGCKKMMLRNGDECHPSQCCDDGRGEDFRECKGGGGLHKSEPAGFYLETLLPNTLWNCQHDGGGGGGGGAGGDRGGGGG